MNTTALTVINLAASRAYLGPMASSAQLCLADARGLYKEANYRSAAQRAVDSLSHSVGMFHADYQNAVRLTATL